MLPFEMTNKSGYTFICAFCNFDRCRDIDPFVVASIDNAIVDKCKVDRFRREFHLFYWITSIEQRGVTVIQPIAKKLRMISHSFIAKNILNCLATFVGKRGWRHCFCPQEPCGKIVFPKYFI